MHKHVHIYVYLYIQDNLYLENPYPVLLKCQLSVRHTREFRTYNVGQQSFLQP